MGEFQDKRANEGLQHLLAAMGLTSELEIGRPTGKGPTGPGETAPSSLGEIPSMEGSPQFEAADPAAPATEPLDD